MIQLVFATTEEGQFGAAKGMPWRHISQDFKNFKARTENTTLIMGAKTFMSLPGKLADRKHIVVRDPSRTDTIVAKNGDEPNLLISINGFERILKNRNNDNADWVSVIGGADLLKRALPFADRVIKTEIWDDFDETTVTQYFDETTVTQYLDDSFLFELETEWFASESHYYRISFNTQIEESVLQRTESI